MLAIEKLSKTCSVRRMRASDTGAMLALCVGNPLYYACRGEQAAEEGLLEDLTVTPPGTGLEDKYFIGFYQGDTLAAIMDLIDGYPAEEYAFIGFFMTDARLQGQGFGTRLISEAEEYLKAAGKKKIRLGIDKGNPQSAHFWKKNGFTVVKEVQQGTHTILVAEKPLQE